MYPAYRRWLSASKGTPSELAVPLHPLQRIFCNRIISRVYSSQLRTAAGGCQIPLSLENEISCLEGLARFPSTEALIDILQRCRNERNSTCARRLHVYMQQKNLHRHKALGNYLVSMLADCGCLQESKQVFDALTECNVYSYNALIWGYIQHGSPQQVKFVHQKMQKSSVQPTTYTIVALLTACSIQEDVEWGYQLLEEIVQMGLEKDVFVGNALVNMFSKCGSLLEANEVFNKLSVQDVVSWSSIMAGHSAHGDHDKVLDIFTQMQQRGVAPNIVTFMCSLKSCSALNAIDSGLKIYSEAVKLGHERDIRLVNSLIDMFCKCGNIVEAHMVFDKLWDRDIVSWNALIAGYVGHGLVKQAIALFRRMLLCNMLLDDAALLGGLRACAASGNLGLGHYLHAEIVKRGMEGDFQLGNTLVDMLGKCSSPEEARSVFDRLPSRNVVSLSAMITSYTEHGCGNEALKCFEQIQVDGLSPDAVILTSCLKACCYVGAVQRGQEVHNEIIKYGFEMDTHVGTALVDMYGEFGLLVEARTVFDDLPMRSLLAWSALLKGYGTNHETHMALQCFQCMREEGIEPDAIAYTSLLVACSHTSLTSEGKDYFQLMEEEPENWSQTIQHFSCFLDLLARAGRVDEAASVFDALRTSPSKEMWKALLSACKFYGQVEMGLKCFKRLTEIAADDASAYAMMIDLYNSAGRFAEASNLEKVMMSKKATQESN